MNDFLYVFCKGGDKRPAGNKEYLGLFHGMMVDAFDPYLRYGKNDIIGDLQKKVFAVLKCPKTWTQQIQDAIQVYEPDNLDLNNVSTLKRYRQRKGYVDFEELGVLLNMLTLNSDILSPNSIPIIDCMKLTPSIFKDATKKEFVHLIGTKDFNAHSEGTFTFGDTGSGDDFDTLTLSCADIANLTDDLKYQHNHSNNESSQATITENLGGHTLTFENNNPPAGNPTSGNIMSVAHNGVGMSNQQEGAGTTIIDGLYCKRTVNASNSTRAFVNTWIVTTGFDLYVQNCMMDSQTHQGTAIAIINTNPVSYVYNNVIWGGSKGVYLWGGTNANSIYENNSLYNITIGMDLRLLSGTFRNNLVVNCGTNWFQPANAIGRNNGTSDATGEDGDFSVGSGNQSNIVIADEVLSTDDTLSTFMDAKAGGVCEDGGAAPGIAENTHGIRGRERGIGGTYTIGAAEILGAVDVEVYQTKQSIVVTPGSHSAVTDVAVPQTMQHIDVGAGSHSVAVDILIQQTKQSILVTAKNHIILIVRKFLIIIGKGLRTMNKKVVFNFDYPQNILPVVELNEDSTAHGDITMDIDDLEEVTSLTAVIYLCNPPSSSSDNWQGIGGDVFTTSILNLTSKKLTSGKIAISYIFDPSGISGIDDGQFYGVIIKINAADDAAIAQAGIEMIMKINNNIIPPA